jgi:hypothetical protein
VEHPNILSNYRYRFEQETGNAPVLTDNELSDIIREVGTLSTSQEQDDAVLEEMKMRSAKNAESIRTAQTSYGGE